MTNTEIINFITAILSAISDFLQEPPIMYLLACVILLFIVKVFQSFISFANKY